MARGFESRGRATVSLLLAVSLAGQLLAAGPVQAQVQFLSCPAPGFGEVIIPPAPGTLPFVPLTSLRAVPNPVIPKDPVTGAPTLRADLTPYVVNLNTAIQLGKSLFWEMQAGSDNQTACATCHFKAGVDARDKNQLNPGANGSWDGYGANWSLAGGDYPFTDPVAGRDQDNIAGSQGVKKSLFKGLGRNGTESVSSVADPVFSLNGVNVRQVTGKNAPSAFNAVFNHRNFHNGRAQADFNGVNPFGGRDTGARVWMLDSKGTPVQIDIRIQNASLASQAVGPVLNDVEMSAAGRTFPDLARKLLALKPLGLQRVAATDGVLGGLADTGTGKGLKVSYATLIQQAFQPKWWNSKKSVSLNGKSYSMMEANFSLFWGLSLMLYQATLVSDGTPMDQYVASRVYDPNSGALVGHNPALLDPVVTRLAAEGITAAGLPGVTQPDVTRDDILAGLALFELPPAPMVNGAFQTPPPAGTGVGCAFCHVGAETTSASVQNLVGQGLEPGDVVFKNAGFDLRMERMFMALPPVPAGTTSISYDSATYTVIPYNGSPAEIAVYDVGWYNVGARPTADDPGLGEKDPFGNFLSWTQLFQALPNPNAVKVPGGGLGCPWSPPAAPSTSPFAGEVLNPLTGYPLLTGPLQASEANAVAGSFKTSSLRNAELTGPYFHTGGKATLAQALELYDRGGDFDNPTKSPLVRPLGLTADQLKGLVAFLLALTDERVRWQRAPFDHPQLFVPNGHNPDGTDNTVEIPAVGGAGGPTPLPRFLGLNPFQR